VGRHLMFGVCCAAVALAAASPAAWPDQPVGGPELDGIRGGWVFGWCDEDQHLACFWFDCFTQTCQTTQDLGYCHEWTIADRYQTPCVEGLQFPRTQCTMSPTLPPLYCTDHRVGLRKWNDCPWGCTTPGPGACFQLDCVEHLAGS